MKIAIVGTGYVGLVTGACLAEFGHHVTCIDRDAGKIDNLNKGIIPIFEPGLESLVQQTMKMGRLAFTTKMNEAVPDADAVFIAVGTPIAPTQDKADLSYVFEAAREIADNLKGYTVVVTKSTVPVGTSRQVAKIIRDANPRADFDMASNPEFLREGSAINDFMKPDRVVVGVDTNSRVHERARHVLHQLYRPLYLVEIPLVFTSIETAELIKYAANGFLALKIAFINEIADVCEKTGADIEDVARGVGLDDRIGRKFLNAGPGFGGSCFPKDARALVYTARDSGAPTQIIEAVVASNDARKCAMASRVIDALDGNLAGKKIAILGVTFKPNTDDMRDAPSLSIIPILQQAGAVIHAYDPVGQEEASHYLQDITWEPSSEAALKGAEAAVIITEWNEFRALDFDHVKELMAYPLLIDMRNIYRLDEMAASGFDYISIGRTPIYGARAVRQLKTAS